MQKSVNSSALKSVSRLVMVKNALNDIPVYSLPDRYKLHWYQPGDEAHWLRIQRSADLFNDISPETFAKSFPNADALLPARQCYITEINNKPIGTATAWFEKSFRNGEYGRIHWVAILPEYQGQGISNAMMSIICQKLRNLKHHKVYLTTSFARIPAINLYLKFGFVPELTSSEALARWKNVEYLIKKREDAKKREN